MVEEAVGGGTGNSAQEDLARLVTQNGLMHTAQPGGCNPLR